MKLSTNQFKGRLGILLLSVFSILSVACDGLDMSDNEMKGVLTVDKAQYGNDKLEFNDKDSNTVRFLYPGRKIFKIDQGVRSFELTIMDSGRAKLAHIEIPRKLLTINEKEKSIFAEGRKIDQPWDLQASRVSRLLQIEYAPTRASKTCETPEGPGLTGTVWQVTDFRYDYVVRFINDSTKKDIGTFQATGEARVDASQVKLQDCRVLKKTYQAPEAFQ